MISDRLDHAGRWPLGAAWAEISAELARLAARGANLPEGEYPLPFGAKAVVQVYVSREPAGASYENHHAMADVQTVLDGEEYMNVVDAGGLTIDPERDGGSDAEFFQETPPPTNRVLLRPGVFALVLPGEAHMPCLAVELPSTVKKLVAKIPASLLSRPSSQPVIN